MKLKNIAIFLMVTLSFSTVANTTCSESTSPLYQADANDDLQVDIVSDFDHINGTSIEGYKPYSPGIMSYKEKNGKYTYLAVQVDARGNSRYRNCEWRPLTLVFEGEEYTERVLSKSKSRNHLSIMLDGYNSLVETKGVTSTFGNYKKSNNFKTFLGEENKNNIFVNTGKIIRLVSHCGDSRWYEDGVQILGGKTKEEQERKLLQEHYFYQLLGTMKSTTMTTRLATINYRNTKGDLLTQRKAFFMEDAGRMAKRCNLKKGRGNSINNESSFQLDLINKFIINNDYYLNDEEEHNIMMFHDENTKETHLIGYDYDLSALIHPHYRKNRDVTQEQHLVNFNDWLNRYNTDDVKLPVINRLLSVRSKMLQIINNSFLTREYKKEMKDWLVKNTKMLNNYVHDR